MTIGKAVREWLFVGTMVSDEQPAPVRTLSLPSHEDLALTVSPVLRPVGGPKNVAPRAPYHAHRKAQVGSSASVMKVKEEMSDVLHGH